MRKNFASDFHNSSTVLAPLPARLAAMKKALLALLVVAAASGTGYGAWLAWGKPAQSATPRATAVAELGDLEDTVSATGTLQPRDYVDVGTQVSGQVKALHADIGDTVTKGQLLAEIDPTVYRSRVEASRAQLLNLQAQLVQRERSEERRVGKEWRRRGRQDI